MACNRKFTFDSKLVINGCAKALNSIFPKEFQYIFCAGTGSDSKRESWFTSTFTEHPHSPVYFCQYISDVIQYIPRKFWKNISLISISVDLIQKFSGFVQTFSSHSPNICWNAFESDWFSSNALKKMLINWKIHFFLL